MTPDSSARIGLHPSIVLPAYVEPLIRGRRVAVLGDATVGLAEELTQRARASSTRTIPIRRAQRRRWPSSRAGGHTR